MEYENPPIFPLLQEKLPPPSSYWRIPSKAQSLKNNSAMHLVCVEIPTPKSK